MVLMLQPLVTPRFVSPCRCSAVCGDESLACIDAAECGADRWAEAPSSMLILLCPYVEACSSCSVWSCRLLSTSSFDTCPVVCAVLGWSSLTASSSAPQCLEGHITRRHTLCSVWREVPFAPRWLPVSMEQGTLCTKQACTSQAVGITHLLFALALAVWVVS